MDIQALADTIKRGEKGEQLQVNYEGTWENASVDSCKSFRINYLLADNIRIKPREYWAFVPSSHPSARWGTAESVLFPSKEVALERYHHVEGRAVRMVDAP